MAEPEIKEEEKQQEAKEEEKAKEEKRKRRRIGTVTTVAIGALDIGVLFLGTRLDSFHIAWSVGCVGVITFLGVLMLVNYLSDSDAVDKGEMRKAIAGSVVAVYFALVSLLTFRGFYPQDTELAKTIVGHFTWLVGIVVVFYFGSRAATEYMEIRDQKRHSGAEQQKPK